MHLILPSPLTFSIIFKVRAKWCAFDFLDLKINSNPAQSEVRSPSSQKKTNRKKSSHGVYFSWQLAYRSVIYRLSWCFEQTRWQTCYAVNHQSEDNFWQTNKSWDDLSVPNCRLQVWKVPLFVFFWILNFLGLCFVKWKDLTFQSTD